MSVSFRAYDALFDAFFGRRVQHDALHEDAGRWTWSGSSAPFSTISSTSATVILPAIAHIGLKLRAVRR
jgi:hypothetical protein